MVAIYDGIIVGIGAYEGPKAVDVKGQYLCPGFIDGHFHIESTMLTPPELAKAVLPHGTTTIIADPHEIANVMGNREGIHYIIESSIGLVTDQLITKSMVIKAPVKNGVLVSDAEQDVIKIAVVERHHSTGNIGLGMIQGFGLKQGALASMVAHGPHNIISVGCKDQDIYGAVKAVEKMGGGLAAV